MENPWVAWFAGEYLNKTRHLTMGQHGAYSLLLWEYYINGPISARAQQVLNICSAHAQHEKDDVAFVLSEFFILEDGFYHNARADAEISKRDDIRNKRVKAGKARHSTCSAHAEHMQTQSHIHIKAPLTGAAARAREEESPSPENLHPLNYARELLEDLNFPLTGDNMRTVAMSIEAEIKSGKTAVSAYEFILAGTRDAKDEGWEINRFFFADAKYRPENRRNSHGTNKPKGINNSTQVKRAFNNIAAVASVLGGSNRVATATGSAKVEHPRLGNGSGQKARSSPAHPTVLDGKVKKDS